jgi:predicted dehydrogenase
MNSRRKFISDVSKGVILTSVALSPVMGFATELAPDRKFINKDKKLIRIGIIGAENSHTLVYADLFNIQKAFPGVELQYVWGETEELAKKAMEDGKIPYMVQKPEDMLGKIDALIVDHRHGKFHLEPAIPFIKAGIPTFIDKPFCYRLEEGKKFLELASTSGAPVTSYSNGAYSDSTIDMKKQVEEIGKINHMVCYGPVDIESIWGGVFFYGIHLTDTVTAIFGDIVEKVRVTRNGKNAVADLALGNGTLVTLVFLNMTYAFAYYAETKNGLIELKPRVEEAKPEKAYVDMVEMFRTGKEPRSHESILYSVALLESLEKSVTSQNWEVVKV